MRVIDLFAGVGGFSLAAKWMGWETIAWVEINEYCQIKLKKHFPDAQGYGDITKTSFLKFGGGCDIVTGGFPCQDISSANGKAVGIMGERSGLWKHYKRAIHEAGPKWVIIENSPMLLRKGFEVVLQDLSEIGYNAQWECISAGAFGFPHKRERLFIIAYPNGFGQPGQGNLFENFSYNQTSREWEANRVINAIQRKTLPPLCDANYGFPEFVVKNGIETLGNAALHALGNAVVPWIPLEIFKSINNYEILQSQIKTTT